MRGRTAINARLAWQLLPPGNASVFSQSLTAKPGRLCNVVHADAGVTVQRENVGSAEEYADQAATIAAAGGGKKTPVYEAGLANLTQQQTTMLAHLDGGKVEQLLLVRVEDPEAAGKTPQPAG